MTQLLLRIEKGTLKCSWSQLTACLARSLDVRDTIASISRILEELSPSMTQVVADIPLPPQAAHTDTDSPTPKRIRCSGSGVQRWREVRREWLLEKEENEAIPDIAILWEDPTTTYPRRAWSTIRAFHDALNPNVSVWIHKLRRKGRSTLAAHGTSLMGSDGSKAKLR